MTGKKTSWFIALAALLFLVSAFSAPKKVKLLTFRYLSKLDFEYGKTPVPAKLLKLGGTYVKIRGYIAPIGKTKGMDEFILLPVTLACCFLEAPPVHEQVWVNLSDGLAIDYTEKMITLKGTLHIEEKVKNGELKSLTHLKADYVKMPD